MSLCSLQTVLEACNPPQWSGDEVGLTVATGKVVPCATLRELEKSYVFPILPANRQPAYDKGSPCVLDAETAFTLSLPRMVTTSVVARNLTDLLTIDSATWEQPKAYFLITEEESKQWFCFEGGRSLPTVPMKVKRYHEALELWTLIKGQAEYVTDTPSLLFFGGIRRTEIFPRFGVDDLAREISLKKISDFLANQERPKTQSEIFRSVLSEFLKDQKPDRAFAYLLGKSGLFAQRLDDGLNIYLSDNSPEKLEEMATANHFELAEKLEKLISGMEAKSLTIPAAVLLAIKEVHFGERWVTLNTIILASALLYCAAMTVAHLSQRSMLKLLKKMIEKSIEDLRLQGLDKNPVLAESFESLKKRRRNSALGSWAMWFFSIVPLIAVMYAAFFASPPPKPPASDSAVHSSLGGSNQKPGEEIRLAREGSSARRVAQGYSALSARMPPCPNCLTSSLTSKRSNREFLTILSGRFASQVPSYSVQ